MCKKKEAGIVLWSSKNQCKLLLINLLKINLDSFTGELSQTLETNNTTLENRKWEILSINFLRLL